MQKESKKILNEKQRNSLNAFFKIYIDFIEVELYNSLLEISVGRCNGILYEFLRIVNTIINIKGITEEESKELLEKMTKVLEVYKEEYIIKSAHRLQIHLTSQDIDFFIDDDLIRMFDLFFVAINDFVQILPKIHLNEKTKQAFNIIKDKKPTFTQALLEFNNALSHIAIAIYDKDKQDSKANIKKAKAHLYRGSLDCYKMLLRFLFVNCDTQECILETYKKTRIQEFCGLGGETPDKLDLINKYKEIVNELVLKMAKV